MHNVYTDLLMQLPSMFNIGFLDNVQHPSVGSFVDDL